MIRCELPLPPTMNHCYVNALIGTRRQRVLTRDAKDWLSTASMLMRAACHRSGWAVSEEKVVVEVHTYWPDARKRDTHNLHKLLADAAEGCVVVNDCTLLVRDMDYTIDRKRPRLEIAWYALAVAE